MKWFAVWEDLEWEIKWNEMNNHHILSNTATWHFQNEHSPKETVSNDGRSKTSSFIQFNIIHNHNHISLSHSPFNENSSAYWKQFQPNWMVWRELRLDNSNDWKSSKLQSPITTWRRLGQFVMRQIPSSRFLIPILKQYSSPIFTLSKLAKPSSTNSRTCWKQWLPISIRFNRTRRGEKWRVVIFHH